MLILLTRVQGLDNGWWSTLLGSQTFLRDYGSCAIVDGVKTCNLSTSKQSAGSSVQSGGIMVACMIAPYINDYLGRRYSIVATAVISIIGIIIEMTSAAGEKARFGQFVGGKVIASLAMGLCANIVPIYLSETSTPRARGAAVGLYQNVLMIGAIVASGTVYATSTRTDSSAYLIPMGLQLIPPAVMITASPFLPESPRWLVWKGRLDAARQASDRLFKTKTNGFDAVEYVNSLEISVEEDRSHSDRFHGWTDVFRGPDLRRFLIATGIQCLQQAQGSSYMNNYIVSFLQAAGVSDYFPIVMAINVIYWASILSGHYLPDKFGRRIILYYSTGFCGVCLLIVSIINTVIKNKNSATSKAAIALICLWNVGFGVLSPLVWITTAEAAPTRNRERVLATAVFFGFGVSLLISSVSPFIQDPGYGNLGARIGFIWSSFSFVTIVWVFFFLPEMKGFSLEQLDYLYKNKTPTRKFGKIKFTDEILADELVQKKQILQGEVVDTENEVVDTENVTFEKKE
ncbi:hypothetical protein A1O1_02800 [Capronia coronata CBS 617.96]|uniref:Major facilitator superfamily (MFS) profile domain-containing protein n=1 Tax=Capronia coronata CBS 617.96 TaxID=1182541 RepID=W9YYR1_9EURO|nr:uncharacterized protein A1O1_02800 [Capronia coronata CBS 617.96]EXJ94406.1 hypothetical protein A1O1_02800 [Capronia coronata CBS 617.96]